MDSWPDVDGCAVGIDRWRDERQRPADSLKLEGLRRASKSRPADSSPDTAVHGPLNSLSESSSTGWSRPWLLLMMWSIVTAVTTGEEWTSDPRS